MSKLNKHGDWDIRSLMTYHVIFSDNLNIDTVYDRYKLIDDLEKLFYQKKIERLLVGIILGMLAGFIIAGVMFAIGRF